MLRVGQLTDTFLPVVDGVGRVALAYSETLCRLGHQVTVLAPMYDTGYRGGYPFELVDFHAMTVPGIRQYKTGSAPMDAHYRQRLRMIPLDVVHAHSPFAAGSEGLRLARTRGIPLIGSFHSKYYDDFFKFTKSEALSQVGVKIVVDFYNHCDEVWVVGESVEAVLRQYGFRGDIQVMPNGAQMREPQPDAVREIERAYRLGDAPVLLFVGQMDWKKNIHRILEAAARLNESGERFTLVLAGQGPDSRAIHARAVELGIGRQVIMTGHIQRPELLDGLYARACLFAFPSVYDNAPMVVREAAVMGTPSVLVRGASAADCIMENENGYLCENTAEDLCRVFREAIADPDRAKAMGERARETIPVPWEKVVTRAVERYERLVALGGHREHAAEDLAIPQEKYKQRRPSPNRKPRKEKRPKA